MEVQAKLGENTKFEKLLAKLLNSAFVSASPQSCYIKMRLVSTKLQFVISGNPDLTSPPCPFPVSVLHPDISDQSPNCSEDG